MDLLATRSVQVHVSILVQLSHKYKKDIANTELYNLEIIGLN